MSTSAAAASASSQHQHHVLDGESLTPERLVAVGYDPSCRVSLSEEAWQRVREGRAVIDSIVRRGETVYGINTGFGSNESVAIDSEKLAELQVNLIRSHAVGTGQPLTPPRTRMLLALRINVLAKGFSGVRPETLRRLLAALNANCVSVVPKKGSVGASGDLAPLAHLALGMLGEGRMWEPGTGRHAPAAEVLARHGLEPVRLTAKEGLALINGTQMIASVGAEALVRARRVARQADVVAALSVEALRGTSMPYHPAIHAARPHRGQSVVAGRLRSLLGWGGSPSDLSLSHVDCGRVQDSYSLRCIPQIHGVCNDTVAFCHGLLSTELNSATDNPMVFADLEADSQRRDAVGDGATRGVVLSGGNFHGEYPAKALDFLAIGVHELSSVSERRIERLVNPVLSRLPAFLVREGGLNSGFMMAHVTAAALVSENKTLCHPASVDSISTSASQEDHVSMGAFAARKALKVVNHVETVLAIELLCACQALDFLRPLRTTPALERVYEAVREAVPHMGRDRHLTPDVEAVTRLLREGRVWEAAEGSIPERYRDAVGGDSPMQVRSALPHHEGLDLVFGGEAGAAVDSQHRFRTVSKL